MNKRVTQDDIIYFIVTDRFFGRNKRICRYIGHDHPRRNARRHSREARLSH